MVPISSFLIHSKNEKKDELQSVLSDWEECEVFPAENRDLLILVTDTPDEDSGKELVKRVKNLSGVEALSLVWSHSDTEGRNA